MEAQLHQVREMLSIELRQSVAAFLSKTDEYQPLFDAIRKVAAYYDQAAPYILGHAEGGEKLNQNASALQGCFTSLHSVTQDIVPRKVYRSLESFKAGMHGAFGALAEQEGGFLRALEVNIELFVSEYDTFLMKQNPTNAAQLLMRASSTNQLIATALGALIFVESAIGSQRSAANDEAPLSLVLYSVDSLPDFIGKLEALQSLYSELCMLLDVSEAEHPLQIGKIESGSLWVNIFGDTKITQLVGELIKATVQFIHRQYTVEGKIGAVPKRLESLDAAIQVSAKLEALGVDTTEMNDHLKKGGVAIAKSLATLLEDQPRVSLNSQVFTIGSAAELLFLEQRKTLLLSNRIEPTMDDSTGESHGAGSRP